MTKTAAGSTRAELGLRERKKQRTRELIADTARQLFTERGFDHVTIAEVARVAEVSQQTVFNYFPTKEDLVYWRLETFEEELLAAIREREPAESVLQAFQRFVLQRRGLLAEEQPDARKRLVELTKMITESPALLAREREIFERYTASLAAVIAEQTGADPDDVTPWVVANALIGVHRALLDFSRGRIIARVSSKRIFSELHDQGTRAVATLEHGLPSLGVRSARSG